MSYTASKIFHWATSFDNKAMNDDVYQPRRRSLFT